MRPNLRPASTEFYERLFALRPDLRAMFRDDDIAGQGMKFMTAMETVLDGIEAPQAVAARIAELGQHHRRLGVTAAMFEPMAQGSRVASQTGVPPTTCYYRYIIITTSLDA